MSGIVHGWLCERQYSLCNTKRATKTCLFNRKIQARTRTHTDTLLPHWCKSMADIARISCTCTLSYEQKVATPRLTRRVRQCCLMDSHVPVLRVSTEGSLLPDRYKGKISSNKIWCTYSIVRVEVTTRLRQEADIVNGISCTCIPSFERKVQPDWCKGLIS